MISYFFHVYICTDVYVFVCVQTHMCVHVHVCKHVCRGPALKLDVFLGSSPRYPTLQSFSLMHSLVSWLLWLANLFWGSHLHVMDPEITCGHHTYMSPGSGDTDSDPCVFAASTFLILRYLPRFTFPISCLQAQTLVRNFMKNVSTQALGYHVTLYLWWNILLCL